MKNAAVAEPPEQELEATTETIDRLAGNLSQEIDQAIERIFQLTSETKVVAINAKMEAARTAGSSGKAFGVVAEAIQTVSQRTATIADQLIVRANQTMRDLKSVNHELATRVRGERLAGLAFGNIDLIDRNLFERSCDVRWWATDPSVVAVAAGPTEERRQYCSRRLGQILDSYTVYFDIVVADPDGRVIANGRPQQYRTIGTEHQHEEWFRSAIATRSGREFGFQTLSNSELANGERALTYSCSVRENGDPDGAVLGVMAIVFKWDDLAQTIVTGTALDRIEYENSRILIVDSNGTILADTDECFLQPLRLAELDQILKSDEHRLVQQGQQKMFVAHARSRGYETYSTGWHSLILQQDAKS